MNNFSWILSLVAGLALFLYGMKIMGEGLEKAAGNRMSQIIDKLTGNLFKSVLIGTMVTAIIQSSNATLVMVVGFINAGIMSLEQSVGVMLGAHIGTTITSLLISLEDISSGMWILQLLKPSFLAPIAVGTGIVLLLFLKNNKYRNIGEILAGFGILFIGMENMSSAMSFLQDSPAFEAFIQQLSNPILAVLVGMLLTLVIQSSSASVGILQAASATGLISFPTAAAVVLGENVGACVTALISSIGTNTNARRAARLNATFQTVGMLIFLIALYVFGVGKLLPIWDAVATKTNISGFHILFNIVNSLLMLPFSSLLVKLVKKLVPEKEGADTFIALEGRLLNTPSLALSQSTRELVNMMNLTKESVHIGYQMLTGQASKTKEELHQIEDEIDRYESSITQYLIRLTDQSLVESESTAISTMFHVLTDVERIGDHAYMIGNSLLELDDSHKFSPVAAEQLKKMYEAVEKLLDMTVKAYDTRDARLAAAVHPLEDVVDYLEDHLKNTHLERLAKHECYYDTGVIFLDMVNSLERIADHCSNIGLAVEQVISDESIEFDPHEHLRYVHANKSEEYTRVYDKYIQKYTK